MKLMDLGQLDTPLVLFGGPYSNRHATEALLAYATSHGYGADQVICTGDAVAYCGEPVETVSLLRAFGGPVLAGNCEKQLAENALDCGCGFEEGTTCDVLSAGWYAHANKVVGSKTRAWMAMLPDVMVFQQAGLRFGVVHGGFTSINRFLWPTSPDAEFAEEFAAFEAHFGPVDAIIGGHCGIAFEKNVGDKRWINTGAIGMPANNGKQTTEFLTLQDGQVRFHTLRYDAHGAQQAMRDAGLVQGYHEALISGHWPSEDVLPPQMRRSAV